MTVGRAIWPEQLSDAELARLRPGVPEIVDRQPDVLVVGGGIVGIATAAACVRANLGSVVVLEREHLGAGASGGAAGQLLPEAHVGIDPPVLVDLGRLSLRAWHDLEATWPGGVGLIELDWIGLEPITDQFSSGLPPGVVRLEAAEIDRLVPGLASPRSAVLVRHQARVNPLRAIAKLSSGLPCVATGVDVSGVTTERGRVDSVLTSIGELRPRTVVFATGTPPRIDGLDLDLPSSEVKGHMLVSEPTSLVLPFVISPVATIIEDGRLLRGGTLDIGDDKRVVRPEVVAEMWAEMQAAWPVVTDVRVSHQWACFRPAHPDHLPVIDRIPSLSNAWLTSGHYKTGILMAPATGQAIADWIRSGDRPPHMDGLGMDRFARA